MEPNSMPPSHERPTRSRVAGYGRSYVALVVLLGAAAIIDSGEELARHPVPASWLVLAALTWISGVFALRVPQLPASISVSETFVFLILLLFGGPPATLTVAIDGLLASALREDRQLRRLLFNTAEPAISIWTAWHAFTWVTSAPPLITEPGTLGALVLPMLVMTSVYFLMNSGLTALAVSTDTGQPPFQIWRTHFAAVSLNYFAGASVALLVALNTREVSWSSFGAILPLVFLLYATFSGRMRRSEDANRHLAELNRLHLSTVESLAMAIDAKDQVTHGHIRRVQSQAVELGRRLGVSKEPEIKALEAAALLHDMGKLSVPDYILNKPGKLTASEYERVKQHAVVGADILSAVEFPYPVVPIVRHHHEHWDGTGYPDGLSGERIPLGARILAVVDCYDALTSDRPYRRALSTEDALAIITARRGREYDPTVVDAFVELQPSLRPASADASVAPGFGLAQIARSGDMATVPAASPTAPAPDVAEPLVEAWALVRAQAAHLGTADLVELVARRIRHLTPATLVVVFRVDAASQELVVGHASGQGEADIADLHVPLGRGTVGWVAANQVHVLNGDPALDAGTRLQAMAPALQSSLTLPLVSGGSIVGVLACYAPGRDAFTDRHRHVLDGLSAILTPEIERADDPSTRSVSRSFAALAVRPFAPSGATADPARLADCIAAVEAAARRIVRATDLVIRGIDTEVLVLLAGVDAESTRDVAERLGPELEAWTKAQVAISIGSAMAPEDGASIQAVVGAARARLQGGARLARAGASEPGSVDLERVSA